MSKKLALFILFPVMINLCGCTGIDNASVQSKTGSAGSTVNDALEAGIEAEEGKEAAEMYDFESAGKDEDDIVVKDEKDYNIPESQPGTYAPSVSEDTASEEIVLSTTEGIDVDLTILSGTMVYSQVFQMVNMPEAYIGKTIRMKGLFVTDVDEITEKRYFACIIQDAAACCAQGIEFELEGEHTYPDDYPEDYEEVTVTGVFDTYKEGDYTFCTLRNARI